MTTSANSVRVFEFTEIPARTRVGGGGGGRKSARLDEVRNLSVGQGAAVPVEMRTLENGTVETWTQAVGRTQSGFYRKGALPFKPVIRANKDEGTIEIYRPAGSDYAYDNGNPVTREEPRGSGTTNRHLTVGEIAAAKSA